MLESDGLLPLDNLELSPFNSLIVDECVKQLSNNIIRENSSIFMSLCW